MAKTKKSTGRPLKLCVEIIPDEVQGGFTAHVPNIPAYGEGDTEEHAIADLKEAIELYIEVRGLDDALSLVVIPSKLCFVNWTFDKTDHASIATSRGNENAAFFAESGLHSPPYSR